MRRSFMVLLSVFLAVFPQKGLTLSDKQYNLVTKVFNNDYRGDFLGYILVAEGEERSYGDLIWSKDGSSRTIKVPLELSEDKEVVEWAKAAWAKGDGSEVTYSDKLIEWN